METKTLVQVLTFSKSPTEIYEILLDSKKHSQLTGGEAIIDNKKDGEFSVFDGYCHGFNIELHRNKKIVQAWHFEEEGWPDDHFSICTFKLEPNETGTKLSFTQSGIPEHKYDALASGWQEFYWDKLK
ncbi:MAG: SRPBCC domain-containing protein [Flavobacteriia bacterium]|jgi:activator of HSP90 ATPase